MPAQPLITDVRSLDTLDDRRELWHLLHRLPPRDRFAFLGWCCRQCFLPNSRIHPQPSWFRMGPRIKSATWGDDVQDNALTNEIYTDIWALVMQYELSVRRTAAALEICVRRGVAALPSSSPAAAARTSDTAPTSRLAGARPPKTG